MTLQLGDEQKLVVVGASGSIATGIYDNPIFQQALADFKVAALLNSSRVTYDPDLVNRIVRSGSKDDNRRLLSEGEQRDDSGDLDAILDYLHDEGISPIVLDVSSGDLSKDHYHLSQHYKIVTANKIPLATCTSEEFDKIVGPNYGAEATVMAGRGIYGDVERAAETGNRIKSIEGVFSGTMGFIMSELEAGKKLSEAIRAAIEGGYTEPNPMDDLDGLDVAKKLVILARRAGHDVSLDDVEVTGLLDDSYKACFPTGWDKNGETPEEVSANKQKVIDEFITKIAEEKDEEFFEQWIEDGRAHTRRRFVASFKDNDGGVDLRVGTQAVEKDSQIGRLSGTENIAVLETTDYPKIIQGPGAGIHETAAGVMENLYSVLRAG